MRFERISVSPLIHEEEFTMRDLNDTQRLQYISGFDTMILKLLNVRWRGYFVNFMFKHISGKDAHRKHEMQDEVMRVYATLLSRVVRRPQSAKSQPFLPMFLGCPDFPVYKLEKELLRNVQVNGGLHFNGILLLPPKKYCRRDSDLRTYGLIRHFHDHQSSYYRDDRPLDRLHATRITEGSMADYAFKALKHGKITSNDLLILPRSVTEL
jgi:hypothetical protein